MDASLWFLIAQAAGYAVAGFALGLAYFGGLWLTLQRLPDANHPQWLVAGSFFGRTLICLGVLSWLADGRWQNLVLMLAGFVIARTVLTQRLGVAPNVGRPNPK